jgi:3-hydroxyisobutyrate dehydrogenase-like beta-hydroxyacid dehydrogenase
VTTGKTTSRSGFIGIGRMGGPMAERLLRAGHPVTVYDRDDAAVAGSSPPVRPASALLTQVASNARIVFASLPTPAIVLETVRGADGRARR